MRLRLDDSTLVDELIEHFECSDFVVGRLGADAIDVRLPDAPDTEQERRDVELHLKI